MIIGDTRPRRGLWNLVGVSALYRREVMRFFKISGQTFVAPVVTALLFLAIFNLAFSGEGRSMGDVPFVDFLVPGLTLMAVMTASYANASFSLMFEKIVQTIVDTLVPPLTPAELTAGYVLASTTRGILVGIMVFIGMAIFTPIHIHSIGFILFHAIAASMLLSLFGLITAIWAEKIDHVASINNFVILPLTFLSGTFYSTKHLPDAFQTVAHLNPFFYMVDGFRYGFLGLHDGSLITGIILLTTANAILWIACMKMFASGYKLKS
jgi:ABC-2 type transport system permease protein